MTNSVSSSTNKFNVAAFFSGVGGIELGFEQTNKFRVVYANEFDKNAGITYRLNFPDVPLDDRDIHIVSSNDIKNDEIDMIVGGFPCQAFSIAGYRKGFEDDRGDLFFELLRMIESKKPRAIFIENVKNMVTHDHGNTFKVIREALIKNGYLIKWKVLNGKDYGNIPQNRERIYIVGFSDKAAYRAFKFPEKIELSKKLSDVIDFSTPQDDNFYYKEGKQNFFDQLKETITSQKTVYQWRRQYVRVNKTGVVPTLTANMGTGGHNVPLILTDDGRIRKLTPKETFNVQGYPKEYKLPVNISNGQLYKQAGNSVVVPLVSRIAQNIGNSLKEQIEENSLIPKEFAIIYTKMSGPFEGESYIKNYISSIDDAVLEIRNYNDSLPILSDEDYFKLIKKKSDLEFYSIQPV